MNKKGQFELRKSIYWMLAIIAITLTIFIFILLMADYKNKLTGIPLKLEAKLISLRFLNNPDCLAYQDETTGRVFSGVIDLNKFTEEKINQCYLTEKESGYQDYNFGLELKEKALFLRTNNYFNRDAFTFSKEVLVRENGLFKKDFLTISVQVPG